MRVSAISDSVIPACECDIETNNVVWHKRLQGVKIYFIPSPQLNYEIIVFRLAAMKVKAQNRYRKLRISGTAVCRTRLCDKWRIQNSPEGRKSDTRPTKHMVVASAKANKIDDMHDRAEIGATMLK